MSTPRKTKTKPKPNLQNHYLIVEINTPLEDSPVGIAKHPKVIAEQFG